MQTLRAFEAAGRLRSYSRAADELGVTHGAISHRIRELEMRLGRRLFERRGNVMDLTSAGQELLASVRHGLRLLERAFETKLPAAPSSLVVSVLPVLASCWLVARLSDFRARHPEVEIELRVAIELADFVRDGIDVAVRYGPGAWANVQSRKLTDETLFPVCAPAYAERMRIERPEDLARCTLLRNPWQPWSPWFQVAGLAWPEPSTGPFYPDSGLLIRACAAGEGVALGRGLLVADDLRAGRLVRPFELTAPDINGYFLVCPTNTGRGAAITLFGDWLQAAMAEDVVGPARD